MKALDFHLNTGDNVIFYQYVYKNKIRRKHHGNKISSIHVFSCSPEIEPERHLVGDSYLSFLDHNLPEVLLPWYNGISLRTRQLKAVIMSIEVGAGTRRDPKVTINIQVNMNKQTKKTKQKKNKQRNMAIPTRKDCSNTVEPPYLPRPIT